jgi:low affinity Fe/Cu permease
MQSLLNAISSFMGSIFRMCILPGAILLFAAEIKLAALKKAAEPQRKLSSFTEKMTKMKVDKIIGR